MSQDASVSLPDHLHYHLYAVQAPKLPFLVSALSNNTLHMLPSSVLFVASPTHPHGHTQHTQIIIQGFP